MTPADLLEAEDVLVIWRPRPLPDGGEGAPEIFLALSAGGEVVAFHGHVDLGTGIRTALAQIAAEELDVAFGRLRMVLGHSDRTPDQGPTIASATIQVTADPLRRASAQARQALVALAGEWLGLPVEALMVEDGVVRGGDGANQRVSYADLLVGRRLYLRLADRVPVKAVDDYKVVGTSVPRIDIPAKVTGGLTFVHDLRIAGMAHGRVVLPPYAGIDSGPFVGTSLIGADPSSIAHIPGILGVVVQGDFVGVVAEREENAVRGAAELRVEWKPVPRLTGLDDLAGAIRANPATSRRLLDKGNVDRALAEAAVSVSRSYVWPYQMHASIGPSCSVADLRDGRLTVWSGTQNPLWLRRDLALLMDLPEEAVVVERLEAAGCYGRNCADDVGGYAALLSRAVGRPVRVQLSREQEHEWEPKGSAQVMDVRGGLDGEGRVAAYDFETRYPSNGAPMLALLLTGVVAPVPEVLQMGDRTSIAPYDYANMRVVVHDMPPIVRASWIRGVSALPNSFAHDSFIDEMAAEAGVDPVAFRLRHLDDARAVDLIHQVAERAGWQPHVTFGTHGGEGDVRHGRGFAYAVYVHSRFPGFPAAWSAWVADVDVNLSTGEVAVTKVTVGQDSGLMINPDGVRHQIEGNVIQSTSRVLKEQVTFDEGRVVDREWGGYPILTFPEVPAIQVVTPPRREEPSRGAGESASVPSAAAIANAIYDATGVRFREPPFTPERVRAELARHGLGAAEPPSLPAPARRRLGWWRALTAAVSGALGVVTLAMPLRGAIDLVERPDPSLWSPATIERGRILAAAGDCVVCHTGADGPPYAGGRPLETPFGVIHSGNITPDVETGIGGWSFTAFERAMRQGIGRDGRHLYPAFPYTAYARINDADMQALYAYLMSLAPVHAPVPGNSLAFPFNLRPLLAGWNALFHRPAQFRPDPVRSAEWNRGAYLVEGLGHCGACHTPRNLLGAEKEGASKFAGAMVDGWEAPPLLAATHAPQSWTAEDLYDYLRSGFSPRHGVAAGPMAPVVAELSHLPDADIRAMAIYLASLTTPSGITPANGPPAASLVATALLAGPASRLFEGACAACHHDGGGSRLFGVMPSLANNSNLHSTRPDNLIQVILRGIQSPARGELGYMPGYEGSLTDAQIADLVGYLRARFAPSKPAWTGIEETLARLRAAPPAPNARLTVTKINSR
ncbi:aldehyde dehydrogenase [Telmatospirillum siberiense]|uniref:Aldehyde dehydrogenase n=2 Tax=Telmatospirillum siberiense TaxID=382514 RepID=A0A2N3PQG9_9PROT|nr:aldehyde dehydrogenase [Telmatospirillum siberiense]